MLQNGLVRLINKSRKSVTILFTDIVDSTRYWGRKGDLEGRLMVDQHNRLVFPVIKKFNGNIVKTIGDAVMASFDSREDALLAAIGIQQSLSEYRKKNADFTLKLRIGIHTGKALVEKQDIFGDTVNVASRVEAFAQPDEILVSGSTTYRLKRSDYKLHKKTSFVPKGKNKEITVYQIDWQNYPSVINDINFNSVLPIMSVQRTELFVYLVAAVGLLYFIFQSFLRYFIVDQERVNILTYSPQQIISEHPLMVISAICAALLLIGSLRFLFVMPLMLLRLVKGLFGYAIVFFLLYFSMSYIPMDKYLPSNDVLYESTHLFVEILDDEARLYSEHHQNSEVIKTAKTNELYLQSDVVDAGEIVWNKVLLSDERYAWIERVRPAAMGVTEKRLSISNKFYFRYQDLYLFLLSLLGFVWGFFSFSVKPV